MSQTSAFLLTVLPGRHCCTYILCGLVQEKASKQRKKRKTQPGNIQASELSLHTSSVKHQKKALLFCTQAQRLGETDWDGLERHSACPFSLLPPSLPLPTTSLPTLSLPPTHTPAHTFCMARVLLHMGWASKTNLCSATAFQHIFMAAWHRPTSKKHGQNI